MNCDLIVREVYDEETMDICYWSDDSIGSF